MKEFKKKTIIVEPDWERMFDNAVVTVKAKQVEYFGKDALLGELGFVIEMLEYGKRMFVKYEKEAYLKRQGAEVE